jgi:hypothetical protein
MAFTTTPFFTTSGKYHGAIWISSHVIMANHICGLRLQHQSLMSSYFQCFGVVFVFTSILFEIHFFMMKWSYYVIKLSIFVIYDVHMLQLHMGFK